MQKHTSPGKPMALEANTEGSASAAALLKLPAELSSPLCCSKALPSSAIQQFCHSAHQCHASNNVSHKTQVAQVILPSSTAAADPNASTGGIITIYGSIRACHTGRNLAYQEKNITKKARVSQALLLAEAAHHTHGCQTGQVLQKEILQKWLRRIQESRMTGQWQIYLQ